VQIQLGVAHLRQFIGRHLELARGFFDEGAGAAAARRLHEHLLRFAVAAGAEEQGLHVFAADFGDEVDFRVQLFHRRRDRHHLLHELGPQQRGDQAGAGAGDQDAIDPGREAAFGLDALQKLQHLFGLFGVVALVVLPQHGAAAVVEQRFDGGGAHVEAEPLHARTPGKPLRWAMCSAKLAAVPATP